MPRTSTPDDMAAIMVARLQAGLATTASTLRQRGFTQDQIEQHGPAAIEKARARAKRLGLQVDFGDIADIDPVAA